MTQANTLEEFLAAPNNYKSINLGWKEIKDEEAKALAEALKKNNIITSIDLRGNQIGDAGAKAIGEVLKGNTVLTQLNLDNNQIGDAGAKALVKGLKENTVLTQFALGNNKIGDAGAVDISEGLKGNKTLTQLQLHNNQIGDAGAKAIGEVLKGNTVLTQIRLDNNQIGDAGAKALVKGLKENTVLTQFALGNNKIGDAGAVDISEGMKGNTKLTQFALDNNQIGAEGAKAIIEGLKGNMVLTELNLNFNHIGDVGAAAIIGGLRGNTVLTQLALGNNQIGDVGAAAIGEGMKGNTVLTQLYLQNNQIGDVGAAAIGEGMKGNTVLTQLYLNFNHIGDAGAAAIGEGLKGNTTLANLHLGNNQIGEAGAKAICKGLKGNKTIQYLYLNNNQIGDVGAKAIDEGLKGNTTLIYLYLNNNQIGDVGAAAIGEGLKGNKTLTQLQLHNNQIGDAGAKALAEGLKGNKTIWSFQLHNNQIGETGSAALKELNIRNLNINRQRPAIKEEVIEVKQEKAEVIDKIVEEENTDHKLNEIFSVENNDLHTNANIEIQKINDLIREGNHRLQNNNEKGILLLGKTGSGKSTLTHLLAGRELQAILDDETGTLVIDTMQPLQEISISHNKTSETKIPNKCQLDNLVIWDCPGFKDTDVTQEIANAFYIKKLCESTKQLKFVLVVSDSEITHNRGTSFVDTVNQMVKTFDNIEALNCSVSLVVTQAINSKQVQHIQKAIERISTQNEHIEPATLQMIAFLSKSVQIFHTPIDEGKVITKTDIMAAINSSTEYCDNNTVLANMSVSKEAIAHSKNLLQMASHNFNEILEIIVSAIAQPNDCIIENDANNIFVQNHELVREWVPSSMHYSPRGDALKSYFMELDQLEALQNIFKSKQDNITSFEEGLDIVKQALKVFEKFSINHTEEKYIKILQQYAYVLTQQFEYIKFFSELCQKELPAIDGFVEVIKYCHNRLDNNLESQIKTLVPKENVEDIAYYNKVIEYLNMYADDSACKNSKARAYVELGNIAKDNNNDRQALEYYIEAIKCNAELPEVYNKLGALFYEQGNYHQAIECYKVTNNAFKIKNCFKKWIVQDEENPDIRMEKGDYYSSVGLYELADKSYHEAFSLSEDNGFKSQVLNKRADMSENKINMANHFREMVNLNNYNNFAMVNEQFVELIGQNIANIENGISESNVI